MSRICLRFGVWLVTCFFGTYAGHSNIRMRAGPGQEYYQLFRPIFPLFFLFLFFSKHNRVFKFWFIALQKDLAKKLHFALVVWGASRYSKVLTVSDMREQWIWFNCKKLRNSPALGLLFLDMNGCDEIGTRFFDFPAIQTSEWLSKINRDKLCISWRSK